MNQVLSAKQRVERTRQFVDRFPLHPKRDQYCTDLRWMQDAIEQPSKKLRSLMALEASSTRCTPPDPFQQCLQFHVGVRSSSGDGSVVDH